MSAGWNTIESDAGVFTYLVENLEVREVQLEELTALDADYLKQLRYVESGICTWLLVVVEESFQRNMVEPGSESLPAMRPVPVYGVVFLFKYPTGQIQSDRPRDGSYDAEAAENIFFASQTIQNACGTQALLSILLNHVGSLKVGEPLEAFKSFTQAFPPEIRGEALSNMDQIRDVHNSFARSSPFVDETQRTATDDDDVYHFIAYTPVAGRLYELDGLQPAPINHGPCTFEEFPDKVIPVLQRRIERYPAHEIRFNLMAMVRDPRIKAREIGDQQWLAREEQKRTAWRRENALRRHNFVGFVGEVLKSVVRAQLHRGPEAYDRWIEDARAKTRARVEDREARKETSEA